MPLKPIAKSMPIIWESNENMFWEKYAIRLIMYVRWYRMCRTIAIQTEFSPPNGCDDGAREGTCRLLETFSFFCLSYHWVRIYVFTIFLFFVAWLSPLLTCHGMYLQRAVRRNANAYFPAREYPFWILHFPLRGRPFLNDVVALVLGTVSRMLRLTHTRTQIHPLTIAHNIIWKGYSILFRFVLTFRFVRIYGTFLI